MPTAVEQELLAQALHCVAPVALWGGRMRLAVRLRQQPPTSVTC